MGNELRLLGRYYLHRPACDNICDDLTSSMLDICAYNITCVNCRLLDKAYPPLLSLLGIPPSKIQIPRGTSQRRTGPSAAVRTTADHRPSSNGLNCLDEASHPRRVVRPLGQIVTSLRKMCLRPKFFPKGLLNYSVNLILMVAGYSTYSPSGWSF